MLFSKLTLLINRINNTDATTLNNISSSLLLNTGNQKKDRNPT